MPDLPLDKLVDPLAEPRPLYDLSTSDLMLIQDMILWAKQFRWRGTVMSVTSLLRMDSLLEEIDRIVVNRAAAGDSSSLPAAAEVLIRKPAGSAVHDKRDKGTGTKGK